jgi:hypothetical protein
MAVPAAPSTPAPAKDDWYAARALPETPVRARSPRRKRWVRRAVVAVGVALVVVVAAVAVWPYLHPAPSSHGPSLPTATIVAGGLPAGTPWSVSLWQNGSQWQNATTSSGSVGFVNLTNGTYEVYADAPGVLPYCGGLTFGHSSATFWVNFTSAAVYPITFTLNGYPGENGWQVTLGCFHLYTQSPTNVVVDEPNGTHGWTLSLGGFGYSCKAYKGQVVVAGLPTQVNLSCSYQGPFGPVARDRAPGPCFLGRPVPNR